jgi:hypothetical protein
MRHGSPKLNIGDTLNQARDLLVKEGSPIAIVYDEQRFAGIIGFEEIEIALRAGLR